MERKIIAIVGLPGSGKTEVINYIVKKFNWPKVYFGDVTFDEMKKRNLEINEKNEKMVREDLREKFGKDHYAKEVIKKIEAISGTPNVLVESLYSWQEYLLFKEKFGGHFLIIAVFAPPKIRYKRLGQRPVRPLTVEEAQGRDYAQIVNLTQANAIAMADYTIINISVLDEVYKQIDKIIENILTDTKR